MKGHNNIFIITSCRTCDRTAFVKIENIYQIKRYDIFLLSDKQIIKVAQKYKIVQKLWDAKGYVQLLRSPFYLNLLVKEIKDFKKISDIDGFRNLIWNDIMCMSGKTFPQGITHSAVREAIEKITLSATLLFSPYPQAYFPQLCIMAIVIPGRTIGSLGDMGERFSDNQRIEGTIPEMLDEALLFVKRNMRTKTIISPTTGRRTDRTDYPITAVREAIINALVHRDYSIHTEGMPIQLIMFEDRIEIHNPGGLYGRITIDQLGKIQPDTRNPVLASALETLGITENRYSGIPTIRMEMEKYNLRQPEFLDERGSFIVKLYKESKNDYEDMSNDEETNNLIVFCKTPRTRKEICDYLGLNSVTYAIQTYVNPLVEAGVIKLSIPDKPKSPKQLYYSVEREK